MCFQFIVTKSLFLACGKDALASRTWPEVRQPALGLPWKSGQRAFSLVRCCLKRELEHYRWASFSPQMVTSRGVNAYLSHINKVPRRKL